VELSAVRFRARFLPASVQGFFSLRDFVSPLLKVTAIFLLVAAIFLSIVLNSLGGSGNQSVSFFVCSASLCSLTALPCFFFLLPC
jgi:hypothetical protein